MKKTASVFLLCVFLFNVGGYFIAFKMTQHQIKSEVKSKLKESIEPSELVEITINKAAIKTIEWEEGGKEFFYDKKLYDIVKSSETASTITYYCINDTKEQQLLANLDEHIKIYIAADKPNDTNTKKITDHFVKLYFPNELLFSVFNNVNTHLVFSSDIINYSIVYIETNSPPPKFS